MTAIGVESLYAEFAARWRSSLLSTTLRRGHSMTRRPRYRAGRTRSGCSVVGSQDQPARGHACARGDQHVLGRVDLVDGGAPHLAHALGDAVHAVDVGLAQLASVRVDREAAPELDRAVAQEVLGLASAAEAELLELAEHERGEVVVDDGDVDVVRTEPGGVPELPGDQTHLQEARDGLAVGAT